MSVSWRARKRAAREGDAHAAAKTRDTYLAGVGISGALVAGAAIVFIISVGTASFDVWPGGGDNGGSSSGVVDLAPAGPGGEVAEAATGPTRSNAPSGSATSPSGGAGTPAQGNEKNGKAPGTLPGGVTTQPTPGNGGGSEGGTGEGDGGTGGAGAPEGGGGDAGRQAPSPTDDATEKVRGQRADEREASREAREAQREALRKQKDSGNAGAGKRDATEPVAADPGRSRGGGNGPGGSGRAKGSSGSGSHGYGGSGRGQGRSGHDD